MYHRKNESDAAFKERVRLYFINYRQKNREKIREYGRKYNKEYRKLNGYICEKRWETRNPLKVKAQRTTQRMLHFHKIIPLPCSVCGCSRVHGHHEDYAKPKEVIWLCPLHHKQRHIEIKNQLLIKNPPI